LTPPFVPLVTPPEEAVMVVVPGATAVAKPPPAIVAAAVLLDIHDATSVIGTAPVHVFAVAVNCWVVGATDTEMLALVGLTEIDWMQPTVTVSDWVPVIVGFCVEVAVIVAVPVATDFTNPPALMVATDWSLMLQLTGVLPVLPSLKVATADICTVLFVLPVCMDGVAGATTRELTVGFTKKPRQLTARAKEASAAKAAIRRKLDFMEDMFVAAPWARQIGFLYRDRCKNCSRDDSGHRAR
jgi:hypothetical protein